MKKSAKTTSWATVGLGTVVTILSRTAFHGEFGAGLAGFGLAHVVLGLLDMTRPTIQAES